MPTTTGFATDLITFSRGSLATVTDSNGYIKWAPHNLLLASEQFDGSSWTKSSATVAANSIAAPNGTTTADTIAASGANGTTLQSYSAIAVSYVFGVWLRRKTGAGNIQIAADNGTYTTVTITNDWALYTVTQTPTAGTKSAGIRIVTSGDEVYAWGAYLYRSDLGGMQANASAYPYYNPSTPKNLLGFTELLTTGWTNTNTTDTQVAVAAPNGSANSIDVAATAGNGTLLASLSLLASPYTFSIWLRRKTGTGTVEITVDGTTYVTAAVTADWQRFSTTLTPTAGTRTPGIRIVTSGDAVYAWGAQLSDSASLDPYVGSYGAAPSPAAAYGPRLDYDPSTLAAKGLLVEEQRTNLLTYSDQFNNAAWTKTNSSVTANAVASPDGSVTADKLVEDNTSNAHSVNGAVSVTNGITYTATVYAKAAERSFIVIQPIADSRYAFFNLSNGTVGVTNGSPTATSITNVGGGWYRCSITVAATSTAVTATYIYVASADGTISYTGDGTSGVYLYGAQLEAGAFATSYIPTAAATVTRNADVAFVATSQFPYNATEGALVVSADYIGQNPGVTYFAALDDGTTNNFMGTRRNPGGEASLIVLASAVNQVIITGAIIPNNTTFKSSFAYKLNDYALTLNGALSGTDTTGTVPSVSRLSLGNIANILQMSGHIRQITYIPRRLTNAELQARTA
jgi:hypothetical protein